MLARRRLKHRGWVKRVVIALGVVTLLGGGVYLVFFSPYFQIESIEVEGARLVDAKTIAGPSEGNILFWKPPVGVSDFPQLATFTFEKDFVNRKIMIFVEERKKAIIWCLEASEKCYWADKDGFIFTAAPSPEGTFVVSVVRDYTQRDLDVGSNVLPDDLFVNLDSIIELLKDVDIPVDELRIDDLKFKEATAVVANGPEIYFSLLFDPSFGESVIESLKISPEWRTIRYVDLRVENRAYYSL